MEGFLVTDFSDRFDEARKELMAWADEGRLHQQYDIAEGLELAPATLARLFEGGNLGKQLLRL
jgi:NADPH-dependent curcumin reductase CurA